MELSIPLFQPQGTKKNLPCLYVETIFKAPMLFFKRIKSQVNPGTQLV